MKAEKSKKPTKKKESLRIPYPSRKPKTAFYQICPNCGALLDYGETCDCDKVIKKGDVTNANY